MNYSSHRHNPDTRLLRFFNNFQTSITGIVTKSKFRDKISPVSKRNTTDKVRFKEPCQISVTQKFRITKPSKEPKKSNTQIKSAYKPSSTTTQPKGNNSNLSYSKVVTNSTNDGDATKKPQTTQLQSSNVTTLVSAPPKTMIPFVTVPPTEVTLSTLTSNNEHHVMRTDDTNLITRLLDKQVNDITLAVSAKYDSMFRQLQESHNAQMKKLDITQQTQESQSAQMKKLVSTQQTQKQKIDEIRTSQQELKVEVDKTVNDKFDKHTKMFSSLVDMIQGMKKADEEFRSQSQRSNDDKISSSSQESTDREILSNSDPDISYSEDDSDKDILFDNDKHTVETTPNTIVTESSDTTFTQEISVTPKSPIRLGTSQNETTGNNIPCVHENQIDTEDKDDIRKVTLSSPIKTSIVHQEEGWNNITTTMRKATKIRHAIISPAKVPRMNQNDKNSPNYNRYVTESLHRRSTRLLQQKDIPIKDHPKEQPKYSDEWSKKMSLLHSTNLLYPERSREDPINNRNAVRIRNSKNNNNNNNKHRGTRTLKYDKAKQSNTTGNYVRKTQGQEISSTTSTNTNTKYRATEQIDNHLPHPNGSEWFGDKLQLDDGWHTGEYTKSMRICSVNINGISREMKWLEWETLLNDMYQLQIDVLGVGEPNINFNNYSTMLQLKDITKKKDRAIQISHSCSNQLNSTVKKMEAQ
jgi:hypothetical protein